MRFFYQKLFRSSTESLQCHQQKSNHAVANKKVLYLLTTHLRSDSIPLSLFEVLSNNHGYNNAKGQSKEDEEHHNKGQKTNA